MFYDISLRDKQKHEFVLASIGEKVAKRVMACARAIAVIRLTALKYYQVFGNGKFEKNRIW